VQVGAGHFSARVETQTDRGTYCTVLVVRTLRPVILILKVFWLDDFKLFFCVV
jgi:hypothetical protein